MIKKKLSSDFILLIGGILFTLIGIFLLSNPYEMDKGGIPNWTLGILFLPFGLVSIIKFLDFLSVTIGKDTIEIKSLFRKRVIRKDDVVEYGIEKYKGKYLSGERIRLFCKKGTYKFHTSQLESIEEIKQFVRGKTIKKNAFAREEMGNIIAIIFGLLLIASPVLYEKMATAKEGELDAIGIPVKFDTDFRIVNEDKNRIEFELKKYKNYLFTVKKENIPENMRTTDKELVLFIENKKYAQELSEKGNQISTFEKQRIIPVDEIIILGTE